MISLNVEAERLEAERRVSDLRAAIRTLWGDRDDARVMSELVTLRAKLRKAERRLEVLA